MRFVSRLDAVSGQLLPQQAAALLRELNEAKELEQQYVAFGRGCQFVLQHNLIPNSKVAQFLEGLRQRWDGDMADVSAMRNLGRWEDEIKARLRQAEDLSSEEEAAINGEIDALKAACDIVTKRHALRRRALRRLIPRIRWVANRAPHRRWQRHARAVRRSPQSTPRRAQTDSGGSDEGDGGGEPPGSSYPTEALNLTLEGAHPSRLRRLRTSAGQFAFCAVGSDSDAEGQP